MLGKLKKYTNLTQEWGSSFWCVRTRHPAPSGPPACDQTTGTRSRKIPWNNYNYIAIKFVQSTCSVSHRERMTLTSQDNDKLLKYSKLQTFLEKSDSTWNWEISDPLEMTDTISLSFPKHLVILKRKWALNEMTFQFTSCVFLHFSPRSPV